MFLVLFTDRMDRELSYLVRGIISQMKQNVKSSFRRQERRCCRVLLTVFAGSAVNLLLLWLGMGQRLYFSAAVPYYAVLFAEKLGGDGVLRLLVGIFAVLGCAVYAACAFSTSPGLFGPVFFGLDTVFLLVAAVALVENPICCLPELLGHGAVLVLLCPPLRVQRKKGGENPLLYRFR